MCDNKVKKGWVTSKKNLKGVYYTLDDTIKKLKTNDYYKKFFGRAKNRTLLKEDPKLYESIYYYSKDLDKFNKNSNSLTARMLFLVKGCGEINSIKCSVCKVNFTSFNRNILYFNDVCLTCFNTKGIKYPTKEWFKNKFGDDWVFEYEKDRDFIKNKKVGSKKWYITKYGKALGLDKFNKITKERVNNIKNLKKTKYSAISQELFWSVFDNLDDSVKKYCYFKELNEEYLIQYDNFSFFADFKVNNKIIEYDCTYWHNKRKNIDKLRNKVYKKQGYELLIITENDFNRNDKNKNIIKKCLNFING